MAPYKIIKQGYMLKEPPPSRRGLRKKLRRYWFVLLEDKKQVAFVYYKNEDAYIQRQRNIGFIRIDCSSVNVIGEYMGYKNAFSVTTDQAKYILVPESRYELHDWIFILHNALEGFHRRMERVRARQEHRQRALSASSAASSSVHGPSTPTTPTQAGQPSPTTPTRHAHHSPTMPTRPAPRIPLQQVAGTTSSASTLGSSGPSQSSSSDSSRRRPKRPAPAAPKKTGQSSPSQSGSSNPTPNHTPRFHRQQSHEVPVFASMSQAATSPYSTLESGQHPVMDLVIAQIEETQQEGQREGQGQGEGEGEGDHEEQEREQEEREEEEEAEERGVQIPQERGRGGMVEAPPPVHARSESDSHLILHRKNSSSLPDLMKRDNSVSPEDEDTPTTVPDNVEDARRQISNESPVPRRAQHTRHLSLTGVQISGKLRKKRRQQSGSLKQRSRSPPNYPPPPPPANEDSGNEASGGREGEGEAPLAKGEGEVSRKGSLGFSQVMSTMSNVSHEVEEMASEVAELPPNISPPLRFRAVNPLQSPVQECPVEEEEEARRAGLLSPPVAVQGEGIEVSPLEEEEMAQEVAQMQFREEEEEEEEEEEDEETGKQLERELIEKNLSPTHIEEKEVTARIFFPETQTEGVSAATGQVVEGEEGGGDTREGGEGSKPQPPTRLTSAPPPVLTKPKPKKNRVMFKEEVEDIPSYEPRIDQELASSGDEDIPSTVAELKMMLFGQKQTQKYTKEGPMSLRYGAIVDTEDYDPDLHAMLSPKQHDTAGATQEHEGSLSPQNPEASSPSGGLRRWQFAPLSPPGGEEGRKSSSLSPQDEGVGPAPQKIPDMGQENNEYDTPWDHKPFSKYSVVGHRKRMMAASQARQQQDRVEFEVMSHTTAVPGSTERRNVHSLERRKVRVEGSASPQGAVTSPTQQQQKHASPPHHEVWGGSLERERRHVSPPQPTQPPAGDPDLLTSISSTLQSRSKYGSDSFLSMGKQSLSQGDSPINNPPGEQMQRGGQVRRSAKADLEMIRTEHRQEALQRHSLVSPLSGMNGSMSHSAKKLSRSHQAVDGGRARGGGGRGGRIHMRSGFTAQKNSRMTQSVDGLQSDPSTSVMYDQYTNSHTFRSLV